MLARAIRAIRNVSVKRSFEIIPVLVLALALALVSVARRSLTNKRAKAKTSSLGSSVGPTGR